MSNLALEGFEYKDSNGPEIKFVKYGLRGLSFEEG